jgi:hypothetical protein
MPDENVTSQTGARKPRPYGEYGRNRRHQKMAPEEIRCFLSNSFAMSAFAAAARPEICLHNQRPRGNPHGLEASAA